MFHRYEPLALGKPENVLSKAVADASPCGYLGNALDALRPVAARCVCNDT